MICEKCGREINPTSKFCPHCGKKVKIKIVKQKKPVTIKIKLIAALFVTICICVAGFVYVQRMHRELDTFQQNMYSTYADLSEIRAYLRMTIMGTSEADWNSELYYCRYYEANGYILVQYKKHREDEDYSYLLFSYNNNLLSFYNDRNIEDFNLPWEPEVYPEEVAHTIEGSRSYRLVFRIPGEGENDLEQIITCDESGIITRWITGNSPWDEAEAIGVSFGFNDKNELVNERFHYIDQSRIEDFISCSDTILFDKEMDDVIEYEYDSNGNLEMLKYGMIKDGRLDSDDYYIFDYNEKGERCITEEYEEGELSASVQYDRIRDMGLDGIVNHVIQVLYDENEQAARTEELNIQYLSNGIQSIEYVSDESTYENDSNEEYEDEIDEYIIGLVTSNNYADYTYRESIEALCSRTNFGGDFSNYRVERSDYVDEFYDLAVRLIEDYGCNVLILEGSNTDDVRYQLENDFDIEVYTVYYDNNDMSIEEEGDNNQETIEESDEAEEVEEEATEEEEPQEQTGGSDWFGWFNNFSIEGKWKNVGSGTFGQAQSGAIVTFTGTHCNLYSPADTYAFYEDNGAYILDCTSPLGETLTFSVSVTDNDNIQIRYGSSVLEMKRVG